MVIIEDTRNQIGKHRQENEYFRKCGIRVLRSKLHVGDYQIAGKGDIVVDTKKDVLELLIDLGKDHKRFSRECALAAECGIKLYILTEEVLPNGGIKAWRSPVFHKTEYGHKRGEPKSKMNTAVAEKIMNTMSEKYGVEFIFCGKEESGLKILELLKAKEGVK